MPADSCPRCWSAYSAKYLREIQPGEMVSLTERGIETRQVVEGERRAK